MDKEFEKNRFLIIGSDLEEREQLSSYLRASEKPFVISSAAGMKDAEKRLGEPGADYVIADAEEMKTLLLENRSYKANRILRELIVEDAGGLSEGAAEFAAKNFTGKFVTPVMVEIFEPVVVKHEERILQMILKYTRELFMCLNLSENKELLFFVSESIPKQKKLRELGEYIRHKIRATFTVDCFVMVGMPSPSGKNLSKIIERLENLSEYRFFMRQGSVLLDRENYITGSNIGEALEGLLGSIYEDIRYGEYNKAADGVRVLVKTIEADTGLSNIYVRHIFIEILSRLTASTHEISDEESLELVKFVLGASDIYKIEDKVVDTIEELAFKRGEQESMLTGSDKAVEEVVRIIRSEYAKADLSMEHLAARVFLSPNYLSAMFKKNKGVSINDFIRNIRLERAKKLLTTTNIKVNEIAGMVGFSSSSYFVTVFRKVVGVGPSVYREENK